MDSWPLSVQWALLIVVGGTFIGCSWWLTLARARRAGPEPMTWVGRARTFFGALGFADWALIALLVIFFVSLTIRTIASE